MTRLDEHETRRRETAADAGTVGSDTGGRRSRRLNHDELWKRGNSNVSANPPPLSICRPADAAPVERHRPGCLRAGPPQPPRNGETQVKSRYSRRATLSLTGTSVTAHRSSSICLRRRNVLPDFDSIVSGARFA